MFSYRGQDIPRTHRHSVYEVLGRAHRALYVPKMHTELKDGRTKKHFGNVTDLLYELCYSGTGISQTAASEKRYALNKCTMWLEKEADDLPRTKQMEPVRMIRLEEAKLEDLHTWRMEKEKITKSGSITFAYWMTSRREGSKVRNVHLGSCRRMDAEAAKQKAKKMKAEALGLRFSGQFSSIDSSINKKLNTF